MAPKLAIGRPNWCRSAAYRARLADGGGRAAAGRDRQLETAVVQGVEGDLVSSADLAEHVLRRHPDVLEDHGGGGRAVQAHLVLLVADADPRVAPFDQKPGELLAVHLGEDDKQIGESPVSDPHLLAVQDEAAVVLPGRARLGAERIRPGAGLAQTVGPNRLAADERAQILLLLGVGAEALQRHDRQPGLCPERRPERPALAQSRAHDDRGGLVELYAAVGLRDVGAHQPELTRATDQPAGQVPVLRFELVVVRHDLLGDELLGGLIDQPVVVGQPLRGEDRTGRRLLEKPDAAGDAGRGGCRCRHWVLAQKGCSQPSAPNQSSPGLPMWRRPSGLRGKAEALPHGCPRRSSSSTCLHQDSRSKMPAAPMPPPTHMVTRP